MLDNDKLQELKDKGQISEAEFEQQKRRLANKILRKEDRISAKSGIVYIILAFFFGAIGVHNFYAKYWKRAFAQLILSLIAPYMLYVPLLFTSFWAMLELLLVNKGPDGVLFKGNRKVIWALRIAAILVLVLAFSSTDMIINDADMEMFAEI